MQGALSDEVLWASGPARYDGRRIVLREKHPDLPELFTQFNRLFFGGSLDCVNVEWSKRMTLCAGQCQFSRTHCVVKLSAPLLGLREDKDLINTLLHEQIHAWLWTRKVFEREDNGHGPHFKRKMRELNERFGTEISPYHDWHAEVDSYRGHWWQCNGPCRHRAPRFGLVKRAMNRQPGKNDTWWADHAARCGGDFIKVREPEGYGKKKAGGGKRGRAAAPARARGVRTLEEVLVAAATLSRGRDGVGGGAAAVSARRASSAAATSSSSSSSLSSSSGSGSGTDGSSTARTGAASAGVSVASAGADEAWPWAEAGEDAVIVLDGHEDDLDDGGGEGEAADVELLDRDDDREPKRAPSEAAPLAAEAVIDLCDEID